jgi:hypothetical protein
MDVDAVSCVEYEDRKIELITCNRSMFLIEVLLCAEYKSVVIRLRR